MSAVEQISLFSTLFNVFLGIAALGLIMAVFFFFYFDIPDVYAMMTGKAKKASIRKMEEQNAMTGKLRSPVFDGGPKTGRTGARKGKVQITNPAPPAADTSRAETGVLHMETPETSVLGATAEETVILGGPAAAPAPYSEETAVLRPTAPNFRFQVTENTMVIHTNEFI